MTARLTALLLLVASTTTGCGVVVHTPTPEIEAWPVRATSDETPRPTALVRGARPELYGTLDDSNLFRQVAYQRDTDSRLAATDYVLDFTLTDEDAELDWYTYVGIVPGVPLFFTDPYRLDLDVLDRGGEPLGKTISVSREKVIGASVAFLPLNVVASLFVGDFGFDLQEWSEDHEAMVRSMIQEAVVTAALRFGFPVPEATTK